MDYGKKITYNTYEDGLTEITSESSEHGKVTKTQVEYEIPVPSNQAEILKDLIDALTPLTKGESNKLLLEIRVNDKGHWKMIKRWRAN